MPYESVRDLPDPVKKLSANKQRQWLHVFNDGWKRGKGEAACFKLAWGVVKKDARAVKQLLKFLDDLRGHPGRGDQGACGGARRRDGSGGGVGNRGTERQPLPSSTSDDTDTDDDEKQDG